MYPVWVNDFEDYRKRRHAIEIKRQSAQNSPYQQPKRISMNLPPAQNDDNQNEPSELSSKIVKQQKQKRRRTPRELMDEESRNAN